VLQGGAGAPTHGARLAPAWALAGIDTRTLRRWKGGGSGIARPANTLGDVGWRTESRSIGPRRGGIPVMKSPFRPDDIPDPAILDDHRSLIRSLQRRGLIRGGLSLGALGMLTGCDLDRTDLGRGCATCHLAAERSRASAAV
jgi:hypothetical protein